MPSSSSIAPASPVARPSQLRQRQPDVVLPDTLHDYAFHRLTADQLQTIFRDPWFSYHELADCRVGAQVLQAIQRLAPNGSGERAVYVHPRVMCFEKEAKKVDWTFYADDIAASDLFGTMLVADKALPGNPRPSVWLGLCKTPTENWIRDRSWTKKRWHTWAVAIMAGPGSYGKHLFFYDCDFACDNPIKARPQDVFSHSQRHFLTACTRRWRIDGVYFSNMQDDGSNTLAPFGMGPRKEEMCTGEALNWILKTSVREDVGYARDREPWCHFIALPRIISKYTSRR